LLAPPRLDAASTAAATTLLNCYLREGGTATFTGTRAAFPALGLEADVTHRSATLHHRFANVPLEPVELARRIAVALDPAEQPDALLGRVEASLECVRSYLEARDLDPLWTTAPLSFIETEQALLLGHPLHPTPKGLAGKLAPYAPELQPRFSLHWLAVDERRVDHDSALAAPATELLGAAHPHGRILIPAHPWEAGYLARACNELFEDLGPLGEPYTPTSSVRTLYREGAPYMLKFSLHARVTNSMRVTLPKELRRAVEAKRLSEYVQPERLTVIHDVAYLSVPEHDGFSVLLRENVVEGNISSLTTLCQDHPYHGRSRASLLAEGRGREWFAAYLETLIVPIIRAYLDLGLTYEPHQQNTLLELSGDGLPIRGLIRDSQGYFHREAAHADLCRLIPALGEASESIFPEALADERLVYYPFVNNALGVIDALRDVVDERVLLEDLRVVLERERGHGGRYPHTLLDRLLDDERWPCKANLRTRLHDLDELVGDISTQSVYVTIPNPLRA
jgi:siderophore synthetase component